MLKALTLRNFQSHKASEFKLGPGLNVITGSSDVGKSSVVRALLWLATNRPLGTSFIRTGTKQAEVILSLESGTRIGRSRGASRNEYWLQVACNAPTTEWSAFGSDVPGEVRTLLNLDEINVQAQLNPHYLVLDPPGQIANTVLRAVRLDLGSLMLTGLRSTHRTITATIAQVRPEIEALEQTLTGLDEPRLLRANGLIAELGPAIELYETESARLSTVVAVISQLATVQWGLGNLQARLGDPQRIHTLLASIRTRSTTTDGIEGRASDLTRLLVKGRATQAELSRYQRLDIQGAAGWCSKARATSIALDTARHKLAQLGQLTIAIAKAVRTLSSTTGVARTAHNRLQMAMKALTVCPTCGQALTPEAKRRLLGDPT